jgi:hypothetical protein
MSSASKRTGYQPLTDAPPAIAIEAMVPKEMAIRIKRSFIGFPTSP